MARPRVFVTRRVDQEALDLLASVADIEVWEEDTAPPREVMLKKWHRWTASLPRARMLSMRPCSPRAAAV